jgi:hypothetical protein
VGDLVVARASWRMAVDGVPARADAASDAAHVLDLARWRRRHGIPRYVFAKAAALASTASNEGEDAAAERPTKPAYVDLESAFSAPLFERLRASGRGALTLTEMLPAHDDSFVRRGGRAFAAEFQCDLSQIREEAP